MSFKPQSLWESTKEQFLNVGSGFLLSFLVWEFPMLWAFSNGWLDNSNTFLITCIFTVTSFTRSLIWRRVCNKKQMACTTGSGSTPYASK